MWHNGLRDNTLEVFDKVSQLNCIKDLFLCGGTGISLLLQTGLSFEEGLDYALKFTRHQVHSQKKTLMKKWPPHMRQSVKTESYIAVSSIVSGSGIRGN